MRRLTKEEFIAQSTAKHGNKYDYSKVVYEKNSEKVCIICKECGREFWQTPASHMKGRGCTFCKGKHVWDKRGRISNEDFVRRAIEVHGDKYGYDEADYKNMKTKVKIFCKECNDYFYQAPEHHLGGCSCPRCEMLSRAGRPLVKKRTKIQGVGILDVDFSHTQDAAIRHVYRVWINILRRCYKEERTTREMSYQDCYVCEEWKYFSNFKKWFDRNYVDGYAIDKDIICKGNRCYCPEYCSFVPQRINSLVVSRQNFRGEQLIGVYKTPSNTYSAKMNTTKGNVSLGTFQTEEQAFNAYKSAKEEYIKEVADDYYSKGLITERVYNALYNWKIEKTD